MWAASARSATIVACGLPGATCSTSVRLDLAVAEAPRVRIVAHLEHAAADVARLVPLEEALDVVAVDRRAAVEAELAARGMKMTDVAGCRRRINAGTIKKKKKTRAPSSSRAQPMPKRRPIGAPPCRAPSSRRAKRRMTIRPAARGRPHARERGGRRSGGRAKMAVQPLEVVAADALGVVPVALHRRDARRRDAGDSEARGLRPRRGRAPAGRPWPGTPGPRTALTHLVEVLLEPADALGHPSRRKKRSDGQGAVRVPSG